MLTDFLRGAGPLSLLAAMLAAALLPLLLLSVTSFVKLQIVFAILRNALGGQQIPSAGLTSVLALALTVEIMTPVGREMVTVLNTATTKNGSATKSAGRELEMMLTMGRSVFAPVEKFLRENTDPRERAFFRDLHRAEAPTPQSGRPVSGEFLEGESVWSLIPAFLVSEMTRGFAIGVLLFLPFLVVDLVIANVLLALGMVTTNPITIAFPIKLFLFVAGDGWSLLCRGLVAGYVV